MTPCLPRPFTAADDNKQKAAKIFKLSLIWWDLTFSHFVDLFLRMELGTGSGSSSAKKARPRIGHSHLIRDKRRENIAMRGRDDGNHFGNRDTDALWDSFQCPIQFYDQLPGCDLGLAEFESLAVERLKLLRIVEKVNSLSAGKYSKEWVREK